MSVSDDIRARQIVLGRDKEFCWTADHKDSLGANEKYSITLPQDDLGNNVAMLIMEQIRELGLPAAISFEDTQQEKTICIREDVLGGIRGELSASRQR